MVVRGSAATSGKPPKGTSGVSRPTHDVYRVLVGEYESTRCWCGSSHDHVIGKEIVQ